MKVIDLFELLIHDEPMPKNIKYFGTILGWDNDCKDYFDEQYGYFFENLFAECDNVLEVLETEVKIIEEDKKIETIETYDIVGDIFIDDRFFKYIPIDKHHLTANEQVFVDKINEIIKVINEMREDK